MFAVADKYFGFNVCFVNQIYSAGSILALNNCCQVTALKTH
jgi:hypothetical protein